MASESRSTFKTAIGYRGGPATSSRAVTQATSKSTAVTLNETHGIVTMNAASLAAATIVSFDLNNALIEAGDLLVLNHISGGTIGSYTLNAQCQAGKAVVNLRNNTAGALAEAVAIKFALIKAPTAG
jgi:hypothetical protein